MTKMEWEVLHRLDRRTRFMASEIVELKQQNAKVKKLEETLEEFAEDMQELRKILRFRERLKKVSVWVVSLVVAASVTTFINYKTQVYFQQDSRTTSSTREGGKDVNLE